MATLDTILTECDGGAPAGSSSGTTTANITGYNKPLPDIAYRGPAKAPRKFLPGLLKLLKSKKLPSTASTSDVKKAVDFQFTRPSKSNKE